MSRISMIRFLPVVLAAGLMPLSASAQMFENVYAGLGWGVTSLDDDHYFRNLNSDDDDYASQIFVGYRLDRYLAMELAVLSLGEYDQKSSQVDIESQFGGLTMSAVGHLPLGEQFSLDGRFGLGFYSVDQDIAFVTGSNRLETDDEAEGAIGYTFGVGFTVSPQTLKSFSFRFAWDRHVFNIDTATVASGSKRSDDTDIEVDTVSAAVIYKF